MQDIQASDNNIAFIGFGEAGHAFVSGWAPDRTDRIAAFDIKTDDPASRDGMMARYAASGIAGKPDPAGALAAADIVFSTVTADQALEAARAGAPHLRPGALWLDCNSCAPETKRRAAQVIDAAGGCYVDVAVMAPVHPRRHLVPLLVSGPHAAAGILALKSLGMKPEAAGDEVGQASSIKMLRSVMVKGLEALCAECFLTARRAGVEAQVIASLEASDPGVGWRDRGAYNLERMMVHGLRRAAEMREVAKTVEDLGLSGDMAAATAVWQDRIGALDMQPENGDLIAHADQLLTRL